MIKTKSVLSTEEIYSLRPDEREVYIINVLKEILSEKRNGTTITEVSEITGFNRLTVAKHLDYLVSIREAYKKESRRGATFFKNGRLIHPTGQHEISTGGKIFSFFMIENNEGAFIYIQEKEENIYKKMKVKGGILIPLKSFQDFLDGLIQFTMKSNEV